MGTVYYVIFQHPFEIEIRFARFVISRQNPVISRCK